MSDTEIVREFLVESYENLDLLDRELVSLEKDPTKQETLASIFRTIHTIKGTCGFLGFSKLEAVAHAGENLLSLLRDRRLELTPEIATALLKMVDATRQMLGSVEKMGSEGERDDRALIAELERLQKKARPTEESTGAPTAQQKEPEKPAEAAVPSLGEILMQKGLVNEGQVVSALVRQEEGDPRRLGEILVEQGAAKPQEVLEAIQTQEAARGGASEGTIRVDVGLLDKLMNLVGELVLARNQILQFTNATESSGLLGTSQRLNLITTELQEGVMKTRMQPIGNIWSKFPRTVRDVAVSCGKQVRIEMEGRDTELDKTIIEAIKDPLTHLVRNAVDHGIERPEVRVAAGKPAEGWLHLRAFHEGGQVNIEISDDGAGLDCEKIRQKAMQKGIVTSEQAVRMSDREVMGLIFLPGFSTAEKITNVSGRGVGMDVVKTNIEKIGGTVDVQSKPGQGTTVRMKIPLTLAIIPALIVSDGGDRYAIPQVSLLELVRLEGRQARTGIEMVHGAPVHRLRGRLLPLVYLKRELKTNAKQAGEKTEGQGKKTRIENLEKLDFELARAKHLLWKSRLREFLDGKSSLTEAEAGSHKSCALGKWLYGGGQEEYGDLQEMRDLEQVHMQLHMLVREIIGHQGAKHQAAAEEAFQRVGLLSDRIVGLLTALERELEERQAINIVVLQADDRQFGLVVSDINDTEEIVVKPLSKQLKSINTFAGATIMGDGTVALILDVLGFAQRASVVSEVRDRALTEKAVERQAASSEHHSYLLFAGPDDARMALPLGTLARLEEFQRTQVERSGTKWVTQYRGEILSLVSLSDVLEERRQRPRNTDYRVTAEGTAPLQVLVCSHDGRRVGLVVERILDIVEDEASVKSAASRRGVLHSAVVNGKVTEILDVPAILQAAERGRIADTQPVEVGA